MTHKNTIIKDNIRIVKTKFNNFCEITLDNGLIFCFVIGENKRRKQKNLIKIFDFLSQEFMFKLIGKMDYSFYGIELFEKCELKNKWF